MPELEQNDCRVETKWRWQFDPLADNDRVQIANERGVILAEVASIKSAQFITKPLNGFPVLLSALVEIVARHQADAERTNHTACGCEDCKTAKAALFAVNPPSHPKDDATVNAPAQPEVETP